MIHAAYLTRRPRKVWELTCYVICPSTGARIADGGPLQFCDKRSAREWCVANDWTPWNF